MTPTMMMSDVPRNDTELTPNTPATMIGINATIDNAHAPMNTRRFRTLFR